MEAMIVLFMLALANASDGDAMVLLVLGIPTLAFWALIIWTRTGGEKYDHDGNKIFDEEE